MGTQCKEPGQKGGKRARTVTVGQDSRLRVSIHVFYSGPRAILFLQLIRLAQHGLTFEHSTEVTVGLSHLGVHREVPMTEETVVDVVPLPSLFLLLSCRTVTTAANGWLETMSTIAAMTSVRHVEAEMLQMQWTQGKKV